MTKGLRDNALLVALAGAIGLPFLNKAFHIDDPFILRISANVLENPLDPFAGFSSWFGEPDSIWSMATNPPLISYYLAPFAGWSDYSEWVLHAAMLPFLWILGASLLSLGRRFSTTPWFAVLFVMLSAGVVVSGNVMRDVPTAALSTAAVACFVRGSDQRQRGSLLLASLLAGLAILMKYSAVVLLPLLLFYALLKMRPRDAAWIAVPIAIIGLWSLHNQWIYGESQIALLLGRDWGPLASWRDNLSGLPVVAGSLIYLLPILMFRGIVARDVVLRLLPFGLLAAWWATQRYLHGFADPQYLSWSLSGVGLLAICLGEGLRGGLPMWRDLKDEHASDSLFLLAWLSAPLLFGVIFVPFQAVRHLIPALPPLVLLGLRVLERWRQQRPLQAAATKAQDRGALAALLAIQAAVSFAVATADYEHADVYRDFAQTAESRWDGRASETWYIGHWGWSFYGERAGMRTLNPSSPPYPAPGDRLVQPVNYYNGEMPQFVPGKRYGPPRFYEASEQSYAAGLRLRAMHPAGAGFYAMYSRRGDRILPSLPYRWLPDYPIESFKVHVAVRR